MAASEAASRAAEVGVIWANPFAREDDPFVVDAKSENRSFAARLTNDNGVIGKFREGHPRRDLTNLTRIDRRNCKLRRVQKLGNLVRDLANLSRRMHAVKIPEKSEADDVV